MECFTCRITNGSATGAVVVWQDDLVLVNHTDAPDRSGWFVVSPVRHVERFYAMTPHELVAVTGAAAALDAILTRSYGSTRTLVASLGWQVADHVHLHVVPTFAPDVSNGYRNFAGAYVPLPHSPEIVAQHVAREIVALHRSFVTP